MFKYKPSLRRHRKANHKQTNIGSGIDVPCWDKDQKGKTVPEVSSPSELKMIEINSEFQVQASHQSKENDDQKE